jgi:ethanolamine permease
MSTNTELKRELGPVMLWGLGVGYVISGMYFGWNLGLPEAGPYGMLLATVMVTIMYVTFTLSYSELACAIPKAGGVFVYADRALGPKLGFLGGVAQIVEFVFAPPAIAAAIGAYLNIKFPDVDTWMFAVGAYVLFTGLNIWGVKLSAIFELVVTVLAVIELLIFAGVTAPHFTFEAFSKNPLPNGWGGAFAAIPFAIWFYLAIEGLANVAEETHNPQRNISIGFGSAMGTLVMLAFLTFFCSVGVNGWETVVFEPGSTEPSDSPLPLAMAHLLGRESFLFTLLINVGLLGLIASFHGIILVAGRATFEFGRVGYAPKFLGRTHPTRKTPAAALILNMLVGFGALMSGRTGDIITMAVFGALTLYVVSMLSLFALRRKEPDLARPYRAPFYPWIPGVALALALVSLVALTYHNHQIALLYGAILTLAFGWFFLVVPKERRQGLNTLGDDHK